jgi:hypothetical protein
VKCNPEKYISYSFPESKAAAAATLDE